MAPPAKRQKVASESGPVGVPSLSAVNAAMRVKMLEAENERLKKQLVAPQPQEETDEVKYTLKNHAKFITAMQKANGVRCLDLSDLARSTKSFTEGRTPKWKPDNKIDAVVATLLTTTSNVKELNLGDAKWATEEKYAKDLLKVVRHYKKNVTTLRCTVRSMVELVVSMKVKVPKKIWWCAALGPVPHFPGTTSLVKVNVLDTLGSMQNLTTLKIVFNKVEEDKSEYNGQFNSEKNKKPMFTKVTQLEIHLTKEWFDNLPNNEESEDLVLVDLLTHWKHAVTFLDMNGVRKTGEEDYMLPLVQGLHALRSIALRVEFLSVTKGMAALESLGLVVEDATQEVLDAALEFVMVDVVSRQSLQQLKRLEVRAAPGYDKAKLDKIIGGLSDSCTHLGTIRVNDKNWLQ